MFSVMTYRINMRYKSGYLFTLNDQIPELDKFMLFHSYNDE